MYGDTAHARLLKTGWTWNGDEYERNMRYNPITLYLYSFKTAPMLAKRRDSWTLAVAVEGGDREAIASYPNINTAALGCTGVGI